MNSNAKLHSCPSCSKKFSSRQALIQHERDAHTKPAVVVNVPRPRRGVRGRGERLPSGDVAPSRTRKAPPQTVRIWGEDRLGLLTFKKNSNGIFVRAIDCGMSPRLSTVARAFQRYRINKVIVRVVPQAPLTMPGGYVAGFVMDPDDNTVTSSQLTSNEGAQQLKNYETGVFRCPRSSGLLWTSSGGELRLTSPGNFWVCQDGPTNEDTSVVITVEWDVTLSHPTLERDADKSFRLQMYEVVPIQGKNNLGLKDLSKKDKPVSEDFSIVIPGTVQMDVGTHYFRVPTFTIEYKEGTGDTGTIQAHFLVYETTSKTMRYSSSGRDSITDVWQGDVPADQVLVPCGSYVKYEGKGNVC